MRQQTPRDAAPSDAADGSRWSDSTAEEGEDMTTCKDAYTPTREDHFTFGLWTVGNRGRDPFGDYVRAAMTAPHIVEKLSELGAWGVNFHDDDLVPFGASPGERASIVAEFKRALAATGMVVPM